MYYRRCSTVPCKIPLAVCEYTRFFHCLDTCIILFATNEQTSHHTTQSRLQVLARHASISVQGSTCPNPPSINVLASSPSFLPYLLPAGYHLMTSYTAHPFITLILEHHS